MSIPLFKVSMSDAAVGAASRVMMSGHITQGKEVDAFEKELGDFFDREEVVTTNSCTSAIHLAFHLIKYEMESNEDIEVIASPLTCAAGIFPIIQNGFNIKWADVGDDCNIDLDDVQKKLNKNTRILTFVHWGGNLVDYDKLAQIKEDYERKYNRTLYIVEDCAHVMHSLWKGEESTTLMKDNFKCFSFQAIKHLTTGDGGALVCPKYFYKKARLLRWFGLDRDNNESFRSCQDIRHAGFKFHMNDIAAAIGRANLKSLQTNIFRGWVNKTKYDIAFKSLERIKLAAGPTASWLYTLLVEDHRDIFISYMKNHGVECSPVHRRNDTLSCLKSLACPIKGNIDKIDQQLVCIPMGYWVKEKDRNLIIDLVGKYEKSF